MAEARSQPGEDVAAVGAETAKADEGFVFDDGPFFAVEFGERALALFAEKVGFAVVVVHYNEAAALGVAVFEVAGAFAGCAEFLGEVEEVFYLQRADVEFEELALHAEHVNEVVRIGEVGGGAAEADLGEFLDGANLVVGIDHVRADDELVGRVVDHAVGVGAVHAGGVASHDEVFVDDAQAGAGAGVFPVRNVVEDVEAAEPGHEAADADLAARITEVGDLGVGGNDAADVGGQRGLQG